MKKTKMYRYLGRNGIITSPVLLDKIEHIDMYALNADSDKILTNGETKSKSVLCFAEDLNQWTEIDDIGQK